MTESLNIHKYIHKLIYQYVVMVMVNGNENENDIYKIPVVEPTTRIDFPSMLSEKIESTNSYRRSR